jgi:cytochrome c oxidase assembly protein subunit 15
LHSRGARGVRSAFARICLAAAALTLVVVAASAYLRHTQSGLSCTDWPSCYARVGITVRTPGVDAARTVHRFAALGVTLALVAMLALRMRAREGRFLAIAAVAIVAGLATLGVATPGARVPAIALANLLGGFALLAVLAAAHARAGAAAAIDRTTHALAIAALALAFLQACLGGAIATTHALLACPSFPGCALPSSDIASLNPWRMPVEEAGRIIAPAGSPLLHVAHRLNGVLLATLVLVLAVRLWTTRGELAVFLCAAAAAGAGAGIAAALVPSSLATALVHNASAALLVALLARAAAAPVKDPGRDALFAEAHRA